MYRCISAVRSIYSISPKVMTRSFAKVVNTNQDSPKRELKGATQAVFLVIHWSHVHFRLKLPKIVSENY